MQALFSVYRYLYLLLSVLSVFPRLCQGFLLVFSDFHLYLVVYKTDNEIVVNWCFFVSLSSFFLPVLASSFLDFSSQFCSSFLCWTFVFGSLLFHNTVTASNLQSILTIAMRLIRGKLNKQYIYIFIFFILRHACVSYHSWRVAVVDLETRHGFNNGHNGLDGVAINHCSVLLTLILRVAVFVDDPEKVFLNVLSLYQVCHMSIPHSHLLTSFLFLNQTRAYFFAVIMKYGVFCNRT